MNKAHSALDSQEYANNRSVTLSAAHQASRIHPLGCHSFSRSSSGLQTGLDTPPHEKQRRRISLACSRCRKRKIKCSGDSGNGLGCQSCRHAGAAAGECQFHRVGSDDANSPEMLGYYLSHSLNPGLSRASSEQRQDSTPIHPGFYGPVLTNYAGPLGRRDSTHSYTINTPYGYPMCNPYGSGVHELFNPTPFSIQYSMPSYGLDSTVPSNPPAVAQEPLRSWPLMDISERAGPDVANHETRLARVADGTTFSEQPVSVCESENGSAFPGLNTLASTLPRSRRIEEPLADSLKTEGELLQDRAQHILPIQPEVFGYEGRPNAYWSSERSTVVSHIPTPPISSEDAHGASLPAHSNYSTSTQEQMAVTSLALASTTAQAPCSAGDLNMALQPMPSTMGVEDTNMFGRISSRNASNIFDDYASINDSQLYTMSGTRWRRSVSQHPSESTLLNGQPYQPYNQLRQIQPAHSSPQQYKNPTAMGSSSIRPPSSNASVKLALKVAVGDGKQFSGD